MDRRSLGAELAGLEAAPSLDDEANLQARARAIDFAGFLEAMARAYPRDAEIAALTERATSLRRRLAAVDARLFARVRVALATGEWTAAEIRRELDRYTTYRPEHVGATHLGFDGLDVLLDGVLEADDHLGAVDPPEPEMVHYEPTPARVVLDLVDHAALTASDVFYDLGSGLGRVVILVSLLTGVVARGVEVRPDLAAAATRNAKRLGLTRVGFVTADARTADLSDGSVFFLFTPFRGAMLRQVLERLRQESQRRPLTICSYGSCTRHLFEQAWLRADDPAMNHDYRLAIFRTIRVAGSDGPVTTSRSQVSAPQRRTDGTGPRYLHP